MGEAGFNSLDLEFRRFVVVCGREKHVGTRALSAAICRVGGGSRQGQNAFSLLAVRKLLRERL
jgi:hypothetical protein